ncbi:sugar transferase [Vibrio breoganii]
MNYCGFYKKVLDFTAAFFLVIFLSPIILFSVLLIKLEDPKGSPIFKQQRIGKGRKEFFVFKLRSMKVKTHDSNGTELTDNERMLTFGSFFRKTSIDELPQLFNIIRGEMSFIGPRPLPVIYGPYFTDKENERHNVLPGISGLAQVNGRNNLNWEEKFSLDLEYVKNISFALDFRIALSTISKIFNRSDIVVRGELNNIDFHTYRIKQNELNNDER